MFFRNFFREYHQCQKVNSAGPDLGLNVYKGYQQMTNSLLAGRVSTCVYLFDSTGELIRCLLKLQDVLKKC